MRLAHAAGPEEDHVLGALDEGQAGQFGDLLARRAGSETEVVAVQRLDRREPRGAGEHLPRPGPAHLALAPQDLLEEVAEGGVAGCRGLGRGDVEVRHRRQAQLGAELAEALMLRPGHDAAPGMSGAANSAS